MRHGSITLPCLASHGEACDVADMQCSVEAARVQDFTPLNYDQIHVCKKSHKKLTWFGEWPKL